MEGKSNGIDTDWARLPPPEGPLLQRIGKAFYNPADKSFLGRTPKRWGEWYFGVVGKQSVVV